MADYTDIISRMKLQYGVKVRRWRRSMSGKAWRVFYHDGRITNWIETPQPKTPISLAIFLHEIGHHAIGFDTYKRRCEEEYYVWLWAIKKMREEGIEPDVKVNRRFELSMRYAVGKAMRRGIKTLPADLVQFVPAAAAA